MTFSGFPDLQGLTIVPNELLDLRVDPYTLSVIMFFARRVYRNGDPFVQATKKDIEIETGIGETKLLTVLQSAVSEGYLTCSVSSSHDGNIYGLTITQGKQPTDEDARPESYRDWLVKRVKSIVNDTSLTDKNGKPLQSHQRRLKAGLWAWSMIFGLNTPCDPKAMLEMISELGASPVKVTRFLLRYAEREPWEADEKPDQKMLAILKAQLKRQGAAREKRSGLSDKATRELPQAELPAFY